MKADFEMRKRVEGVSPCVTAASRKIHKGSSKRKHCDSGLSSDNDKDKAEIKAYLNKLQELVPFMPKDKKLSKVEVISYVIEYIRELRVTLGLPPCNNSAFPDFGNMDILMDHPSPALMMTMTMMSSSDGVVERESSTPSTLNTSISGAHAQVPPTTTTVAATSQQSNLLSCRQPLGVILNPRNCPNGSGNPLTQVHHKFHTTR